MLEAQKWVHNLDINKIILQMQQKKIFSIELSFQSGLGSSNASWRELLHRYLGDYGKSIRGSVYVAIGVLHIY